MKRLHTPIESEMLKSRRGRKRGEGQILVLFVLAIVAIMGFTALVIDVGVLRNANQNLWNALDAGTLAAARELPDEWSTAKGIAMQYAEDNYPGDLPPGVNPTFRCVVGNVGGMPRASDIPAVCDPGANPVWFCEGPICSSICVPEEGDTCNTIVLEGAATVGYGFGNAVGVASGTTQNVLSAACKGSCGTKPDEPVDLVLLVDRTPSLEAIDVVNARTATDAVRTTYRAADQWIALGMIGPSEDSGSCLTDDAPSLGTANVPADLRRWVPVGLSGIGAPINEDYKNSSSILAQSISCFPRSPGEVATDLEDPIPAAQYELLNNGREGVTKGIILMSDGQPNNSVDGGRFTPGYDYCQKANETATAAKLQDIVIFTIAFGLDGSENIPCLDDSGPFAGKNATALLAAMASGNSLDDNGCPGTENEDLDNYFCVPKTENANPDLANLFRQAANALVSKSKLIKLPS